MQARAIEGGGGDRGERKREKRGSSEAATGHRLILADTARPCRMNVMRGAGPLRPLKLRVSSSSTASPVCTSTTHATLAVALIPPPTPTIANFQPKLIVDLPNVGPATVDIRIFAAGANPQTAWPVIAVLDAAVPGPGGAARGRWRAEAGPDQALLRRPRRASRREPAAAAPGV
jgi:hypothetical protein